jgi:hypothetical protein
MALTELELKKAEAETSRFVESKRPPEHIRDQMDLGFRIEDQSVVLFEIRPRWDNPQEIMECPVAKTTYSRAQKVWKVYWQRADLEWQRYEPSPEVDQLVDFLALVDEDKHACFWG